MRDQKMMRCPHCDHVGECIWFGFGGDWVLCQHCQRQLRWVEVRRRWLVDAAEAWTRTADLVLEGSYN